MGTHKNIPLCGTCNVVEGQILKCDPAASPSKGFRTHSKGKWLTFCYHLWGRTQTPRQTDKHIEESNYGLTRPKDRLDENKIIPLNKKKYSCPCRFLSDWNDVRETILFSLQCNLQYCSASRLPWTNKASAGNQASIMESWLYTMNICILWNIGLTAEKNCPRYVNDS